MENSIFSQADHIIGYNSRAKIFNLFASVNPARALTEGSVLAVTYDEGTDDLEIIAAAVKVAGRKLLYRGNRAVRPGEVTNNLDLYKKEHEAIVKETDDISKRIDLSKRFGGEWE
jgi:hypothetical protein